MEGIYIRWSKNSAHTGFVVFFERGGYAVSRFTECTMPFIIEHAAARGVGTDDLKAQVFTCTEN